MKLKMISAVLLLSVFLLLSACKKTEPATYSGKKYVEFASTADTYILTKGYSYFYYMDPAKVQDTVWLKLRTLGDIPGQTSYVKFQAYKAPLADFPNAVSGVHYIPFEDETLYKSWRFEAGKYEATVPIVLKRDPSLKSSVYQLNFRIANSDDLLAGNPKHIDAVIYVSDRLSKPANWDNYFFLGTYGTVKHQFMVEQSGKKWDVDFIASVLSDVNLQTYYKFKFKQDLQRVNEARIKAGLTELREDPALASTAVEFPNL